jgi:hypothetical protein
MSSHSYSTDGFSFSSSSPTLRGGESENTSVIVLTVAIIVLIVVVLVGVLSNMCSQTNGNSVGTNLSSRISKVFKKKNASKNTKVASANSRSNTNVKTPDATIRSRINNKHRRYAMPQSPSYANAMQNSAPLPAAQLMAQPEMPEMNTGMNYITSSSNGIGGSEMDHPTTEVGGSASNTYVDSSYTMDSGMMTPPSTTDIQGLETFMPMMNDGVGQAGGPVDPSTGLPLFTTGKLVRSQLLGGHGAGSFLRQQQDPLSGYSRLGKNMCGPQNARRDLAVRRAQFNEARLADPNGDPVLFQTSEFAYY